MVIDPKLLIIRKPEKGINVRKIASAANAIFFWGILVYLLMATAGWFAGLFFLASFRDELGSVSSLAVTGAIFLAIVAGIYAVIWSWSAYNRFRFGGDKDRRHVFSPPLPAEAVTEYAGMPKKDVENAQQSKFVVCHFDESHELAALDGTCASHQERQLDP